MTTSDLLSLDTAWDRWVHRPVARWIARRLAKTPVSPNQVTLFTLIPAALSAWFFTKSEFLDGLWALLFFYLWAVLDHADGELARLRGTSSESGRVLDDTCDNIATIVILLGIYQGILNLFTGELRGILSVFFLIGLVLNLISGILVLKAKRKAREETAKKEAASPRFVFFQKLLDHFTGRDPFYLLIFIVLAAYGWRGIWQYLVMGILILGMYVISLVSVGAWIKMSLKKTDTII